MGGCGSKIESNDTIEPTKGGPSGTQPKQTVKYVRNPIAVESSSFSADETCNSLAETVEGVPVLGAALATTLKAVGWMISCF